MLIIIWASNLANAKFWLENKHTCDHLLDAFINTIKYLNDQLDGLIGLHVSPWIRPKNVDNLIFTLIRDGLIINFPWDQLLHVNSLELKNLLVL